MYRVILKTPGQGLRKISQVDFLGIFSKDQEKLYHSNPKCIS